MTPSTESDVKKALKSLSLPELPGTLGELGKFQSIQFEAGRLSLDIELGFPATSQHEAYAQIIAEKAVELSDVSQCDVNFSTNITAHGVQRNLKPLPGIRNVIAVASGKGGVGKSTVAVNLALALSAEGARTGLLDADIYGPSQPHMLGLVGEQPTSMDGKTMDPLKAKGLQVMSIGFLIDPDQPMVWRGPMVTSALNQLLGQTNWDDLDYLIIDMPPGTGDIQLTLSQQVPVSGSVIVTTPQNIALLDARKGLAMFRKVSVPVLGVIENMSTHICSSCGHEEPIFGSGGGEAMAAENEVGLLGQLPLDASIRRLTDDGNPTVFAEPDSTVAQSYFATARRMTAKLAMQGKDYSSKFPNIVVEDT